MQSSRHYTQQQSLYLLEYLITSEAGLQKSLSPRIYLESVILHIIRSKNRIPIEVLVRRLSELEGTIPSQIQGEVRSHSSDRKISEEPPSLAGISQPTQPETQNSAPQITPNKSPTKMEEIPETAVKEIITNTPVPSSSISEIPQPIQLEIQDSIPQTTPKISPTKKEKIPETAEEEIITHAQTPSPLPEKSTPDIPLKHQSHYDTLMRFAAVELEGSLKT
jgi:DNA polymerase-3 subunit gamma/tau